MFAISLNNTSFSHAPIQGYVPQIWGTFLHTVEISHRPTHGNPLDKPSHATTHGRPAEACEAIVTQNGTMDQMRYPVSDYTP
jgi:hypothetical protein